MRGWGHHQRHPAQASRALVVSTLLGLLAAVGWWGLDRTPTRLVGPVDGDVVVVGMPGLTWEQITPRTPTLSGLAAGASGSLIVRGTDRVTCPAQGWLTLGAGQRAGAGLGTDCTVPEVSRTGAPVEWARWQGAAADQALPAELGTLGTAVRAGGGCVAAYGPLAALAAADERGAVTAYRPGGLLDLTRDQASGDDQPPAGAILDPACRLHLIAGPTVPEAVSHEIVQEADAALGRLLDQLPAQTSVLVAGLADNGPSAAVRVVVIGSSPGGPGGAAPGGATGPVLLTSASTRQPGLVQTMDLTATVLTMLGVEVPAVVAGSPVGSLAGDPTTVQRNQDLSAAATETTRLLPRTGVALAVLILLPLLVALALCRRGGRARSAAGVLTAVLGTAAMAVPAAAFLAGLLPWWRAGSPFLGLLGATVSGIGLLLALAWTGPWRRDPRGPIAVVAAATVLVIGADVVAGGPLGLIAFLGVQPMEAGRFYGMGNVAFGAFSASALVLAGCVASWLTGTRRQALTAVLAVGAAATVIDGAPPWGADFGGVPALLVATGALALPVAGVRLSGVRLALLTATAVLVAGVVMVLDWLRPAADRSHLGDFVQEVLDGTGLAVVTRKLDQSLAILVAYPASWIAVLALGLVVLAVARPDSFAGRPLRRLWTWPHLRSTAWALIACWCLGWVLNDSGVAAVGMGLTVALGAGLSVLVRTPGGRR